MIERNSQRKSETHGENRKTAHETYHSIHKGKQNKSYKENDDFFLSQNDDFFWRICFFEKRQSFF